MDLVIIRVLFVLITTLVSYELQPLGLARLPAAGLGALFGLAVVLFEIRLRQVSLKRLIGAVIGSILGIVGAYLFSLVIRNSITSGPTQSFLQLLVMLIMAYIGLVVGAGVGGSFVRRVGQLADRRPSLSGAIHSLLDVLAAAAREIVILDKQIAAIARANVAAERLMTVPGVGPLTALAYVSTIDDPTRFRRSADVGAYLGLTPRRYQSGEIDRQGRISKHGDRFLRTLLYEAANVLMTRVKRWSPLKAWGHRLSKRVGPKKAKIAVARKLAIIVSGPTVRSSGGRERRQP